MKDREVTHDQAEILVVIEAKFAQPLAGIEELTGWINDMGALGTRYVNAGGTLDELQARFNDAKTPIGGRFFFSQGGPF